LIAAARVEEGEAVEEALLFVVDLQILPVLGLKPSPRRRAGRRSGMVAYVFGLDHWILEMDGL